MSAHATAELVCCATVRIERTTGKHLGTGFFAAPGLVVTAGHVVAGYAAEQLSVRWGDASLPCTERHLLVEPIPGDVSHPWPDAAILEVECSDHPCVRLAAMEPDLKADLYVYAYARHYDPKAVGGTSLVVSYTGPTVPVAGTRLLRVVGDRIVEGMSGAPLLDLATGEVCAIMKSAATEQEGYSTAIADVLAFPDPGVAKLVAGLQAYAGSVSSEARARWGELPGHVGQIVARTGCAGALSTELARRQVEVGDDLAACLFGTDARTLAHVLSALEKRGDLTREDALELFETVACCVPADRTEGLAWWIPPEAAEQLFRELTADDPRIAHVATDERDTLRMLVRRASGRAPLTLFESDPHEALTPDDSWFAAVEGVIREAAPGAKDGWWESAKDRRRVLRWVKEEGLVLPFPPIDLQPPELEEVHAKLGTFPFVRTGRAWDPAGSPRVVRIEPAIDADEEESALFYHRNLRRR